MSSKRHDRPVAMGVDIGATWIRVAVVHPDGRMQRIARRATAVPDLRTFLLTTLRHEKPSRRQALALVVASRGVWTRRERERIAIDLRDVAARVEVISDAQAALLGALGHRPGVLVLAGTGSIVLGRGANDRWARAGGLGPLFGDDGSGFWLGREWLRATTSGADFMLARRLVQSPDAVARIAALAPAVLTHARRGDRRARAIVGEGARRLAALAIDVTRQLRLTPPVAISWAGSVMSDARYRAAISRALSRAGVRAHWTAPRDEALAAAAQRAAQLAGWTA